MFIRIVFIFLSLQFFLQGSNQEKIIIDTDPGVDDATAIFLMLTFEANQPKSSAFEVIGITCTHGNVEESIAIQNALKILTIAGRNDIPIYSGAKKAMIEERFTDNYYGNDGFGEVNLKLNITAKINKSQRAVDFLIDMAKEHAGNISIVTLGPLTNIGMAIALDENFIKNVNQFYVMGGSVSGIGNIRPNVEFNFALDPESTYILFNAVKELKITLFPWETALNAKIPMESRKKLFETHNSTYIDTINKIELWSIEKHQKKFWTPVDAMSIACIIQPSVIISQVEVNVNPVLNSDARGSILVDYSYHTNKPLNTKIVMKINETLFQELVVRYFTYE